MTKRRLQLVIDGHCGTEATVNSDIPQGSHVSPILFTIYLCGVFGIAENIASGICATSFFDDCSFLVEAKDVSTLVTQIQEFGSSVTEWGSRNFMQFDHGKTEAVAFTRRLRCRQKIRHVTMYIGEHSFKFNEETMRWLGFWLDSVLNFRTHKEVHIQKARQVEARIRSILSPGLVRRIQTALVQSIALYGAEIW